MTAPPFVQKPSADPLLPEILRQVQADLADPTVSYLLAGHYYERTNHPRYRHYPAVFALAAGAVENFELGADFLAFDTEFIRYPERGEPHYSGPWTDRYRAKVPFAQVYSLQRKVLAAAEPVSYESESVVYYNEAVHKNYPTITEMNQAYDAALPAKEATLATIMRLVAVGLTDPQNHYLINTTYFDGPAGPVMMGVLHLHRDTVQHLKIADDSFTCDVLLHPHDREQTSRVRVGYGQVWQVLRHDQPAFDLEEIGDEGILYYAAQVLHTFARQGPPA